MNVLIRNVTPNIKWGQVVALLDLFITNEEFAEELKRKKRIIFDDPILKLDVPIIVERQDNGNLCIDFKVPTEEALKKLGDANFS